MTLDKQITVSEVFSAIRAHRVNVVLTFLLLMILVIFVFIVLPRKYGSEGRLFVQVGRTDTGLDPVPGSSSISIQDSRETEIRSVAEIVKSRAIIEAAVKKIGPDEILKGPRSFLKFDLSLPTMPWNSIGPNDAAAEAEYQRLKQLDLACKQLEESLNVHSEKKTTVISIYCTANSPMLAQKIVDLLMAETQAKYLDVNRVKGSAEFFDENFSKKQNALVQAENRLRSFHNTNRFLSIGGAINTQQQIIDKLELERIDAEIHYAQSQKRLEQLQAEFAKINPTIAVPKSGVEKLSTEESRTELFKLESELKQLEEKFATDHPRLKQLRQSVIALKQDMNRMPLDRTESAVQINPVYEKVMVSLVHAVSEESAAKSRWNNLEAKFQQAMLQLEELNSKDLEAKQIQRDLDIARQEMEIYVRKRSESAVIDQLDQKRLSNVVVAQDATYSVKAVSPRGSILLPMGAIFAGFFSIAVALYREKGLLGGHLSEAEVEEILEIPVLLSLPVTTSHRNMVG